MSVNQGYQSVSVEAAGDHWVVSATSGAPDEVSWFNGWFVVLDGQPTPADLGGLALDGLSHSMYGVAPPAKEERPVLDKMLGYRSYKAYMQGRKYVGAWRRFSAPNEILVDSSENRGRWFAFDGADYTAAAEAEPLGVALLMAMERSR